MHEMSYVIRFVNIAIETAQSQNAKHVESLVVEVGEMTSVLPEYLHKYYPQAIKNTILEGSQLKTIAVKAKVECLSCHTQYHPERSHQYLCPVCQSAMGRILEGRDVRLKEVQVTIDD